MPKITKDPIRPMSVGLRQVEIDFIERAGVGENISEKLRSILERCSSDLDTMVVYDDNCQLKTRLVDDAVPIFEQTTDGEKKWNDNPPFKVDRSKGWQGIATTAKASGYVVQVVERKESGFIAVWAMPGRRLNNCAECRRRVLEVLKYDIQ